MQLYSMQDDYQIQFVHIAICPINCGARVNLLVINEAKILVRIKLSYRIL